MKINNNDFLLVLTPKQSEVGWTGEVDINIQYDKDNELADDETEAVVNLMTLMTTCVDLMEKDKDFLEQVFNHRDALEVENELIAMDLLEDEVKVAPSIIKREGNVIKLDWSKK
tara:strand:+ start:406 stop:747 length:342 start_codon:yes stop_codon:yes gene_type:complete